MSNIFTAVKSASTAVDAVITRAIPLFWLSALQARLRHEREPQHGSLAERCTALAEL